ncbi:GIY-YIG nuclease family protein [Colwellia sp. 75C3]|uniref:GIY-YIG nuclease family protein n=1 Tax=Colwellia sp. 75C3 TaxID=888425 RepID=UPI0012FF2EF9|nr:GIY-YIG nuclease family protein [Colwellia sp. 75C3]
MLSAANGNVKRVLIAKRNFELSLIERGYKLTSIYKGDSVKVNLQCDKGHGYSVAPYTFKQGHGCPDCTMQSPKIAKASFTALVLLRNHVQLSDYVSSKAKVKLKCDKGHVFQSTPGTYIQAVTGCATCSKCSPISAKESTLKTLNAKGYTPLSQYVNAKTRMNVMCDKGHEFDITPDKIKLGRGCRVCAGNCPIKAGIDFKNMVISRGEIQLSEYKGDTVKVKIRCEKEHEYLIIPGSYKVGRGCAKCAKYGFNPNEPGYIYIQEITLNSEVQGYKFGIAFDPVTRIKSIRFSSIFKHRIIFTHRYDLGRDALNLENIIKGQFKTSHLSKQDMPQGFTETISPGDLEPLIKVIETFNQQLTKPGIAA